MGTILVGEKYYVDTGRIEKFDVNELHDKTVLVQIVDGFVTIGDVDDPAHVVYVVGHFPKEVDSKNEDA